MTVTPTSLLDRLRHQPNDAAWQQFIDLYTPLIRRWLGRYVLQPADADDLVQQVFAVLVEQVPAFERNDRPGAFRCWLRTITLNLLRMYWRSGRPDRVASGQGAVVLDQLEDPSSDLNRFWDQQHDRHVARRLLELIEPDFEGLTFQAFRLLILEDRSAPTVAAELGLSLNAVYLAKSRVLSRLREHIQGLID